MSKKVGKKWAVMTVLITLVMACGLVFFAPGMNAAEKQDPTINGRVTNSINNNGIADVKVELSADNQKYLDVTYTDANGNFSFPTANAAPNAIRVGSEYMLTLAVTEYETQNVHDIVAPNNNVAVALVPVGVTIPYAPLVRSGPKCVYLEWEANPEFNLMGYNIYRKLSTDTDSTNIASVVRDSDGLLSTEYADATVQKGIYYCYQITAIGGAYQESAKSEVSDPCAKGGWLTIYFPEIFDATTGMRLWERSPGGVAIQAHPCLDAVRL